MYVELESMYSEYSRLGVDVPPQIWNFDGSEIHQMSRIKNVR